ncbi:MAG: tRNA (adenosine(37)-N6)-threonylcarbamoyltransferase complex transferase subunit TsaD [Deltaproteobacteria bacterium]|nr:tRNA (adenosine(37)-N6)-threonylcarbamoyltransferase complex transferase subunit TsaD [Deltaproteobacteria bacterium]MBU48259.1 tRNA (adenosine(37)-N6)-threonylcarbamoyltransferase complex transferase subunit TsaD [Deltaproteobacteria bacterium]|tara:strand:+ start:14118 stop:15185 length:1068 start_codon:yes stop_codon:yes gene_type:complete
MTWILGIESSCDDTGIAVLHVTEEGRVEVHANVVSSQFELHERYGGVVPELATRAHLQNMIPVVEEALHRAGKRGTEIDVIAVTKGPGLIGALLIGVQLAKSLAYVWGCDLVGVNHLEGHIESIFLEEGAPERFPFIGLLVSGGHTCLYRIDDHCDVQLLGATHDDAAGEAFEKAAKMMALPYLGGPKIDRHAKSGNKEAYAFPRPMLHKGLDFSFSGLKTSFRQTLESLDCLDTPPEGELLADLCASFQEAIVEVLWRKSLRAAKQEGLDTIAVIGGVAANSRLREVFAEGAQKEGLSVSLPSRQYCTDNGAMIACAGYRHWQAGARDDLYLNASTRQALRGIRGGSRARPKQS